jgi:hypothetical protein
MNAGERGGAVLLFAASALALAGVVSFALHRNLLREWAMEGEAQAGERVSLAADSALAWFLIQDPPSPEALRSLIVVPERALPQGPGLRVTAELRLRDLGEGPPRPAGRLWKVTLLVRGRIGPGEAGEFLQVREAYVSAFSSPPAGGRCSLSLRAWRILRE